ncbi:hypothetical protein DL765_009863 [Monosporascus sp. GIB2]|nr:hypothetical protein DL765_009863 [Monosporascus sp. GIB2]
MNKQKTRPAKASIEGTEVKIAESDMVIAGAPTKPETTSEASDVKSDEKAPTAKQATVKEESSEKANNTRPSLGKVLQFFSRGCSISHSFPIGVGSSHI